MYIVYVTTKGFKIKENDTLSLTFSDKVQSYEEVISYIESFKTYDREVIKIEVRKEC